MTPGPGSWTCALCRLHVFRPRRPNSAQTARKRAQQATSEAGRRKAVGDRVAPVFGLETFTLPRCLALRGLRLAGGSNGSLTALNGSLVAWEAMTRLADNVSPSPGEAARTLACACGFIGEPLSRTCLFRARLQASTSALQHHYIRTPPFHRNIAEVPYWVVQNQKTTAQ